MQTIGALAAALIVVGGVHASADTFDRIQEQQTITLAVRTDAPPFASRTAAGEYAGYSVSLCNEVAEAISQEEGMAGLRVEFVEVTAEDRFDALEDGRADLLCGATSATLSRRERVDFSVPTFIDGGGVLLRADGPDRLDQLGGQRIGVRAGTTTEEALAGLLQENGIDAQVSAVTSHQDGAAKLAAGEIDAYFADQSILMVLAGEDQASFKISQEVFTVEPYALAMPVGSHQLRLIVDRTLSGLYRSGDIEKTFLSAFGETARPGDLLRALFVVAALPE